MNFKRLVALGLSATLSLSLMACGGGDKPATDATATPAPEAGAATPTTTPAAGGTEITWWAFPNFGQKEGEPAGTYEQSMIDAFQAANPDITVKLETLDFSGGPDKITNSLQAGTTPDVLFDAPGRIIDYGKNGKLVALDDMFTSEFIADVDNDALINSCKGDGTAYMYPISSAPFFMALNKKMWEDSGAIEFVNLEGNRAWTVENFEKGLEKLKAGGFQGGTVFCGGQGGDQGTRAFLSNLTGATIANDTMTKYTFDSPEGIEALTKVKGYLDAGYVGNGSSYVANDDIELFASGNTAFALCWGTSTTLTQKETMASFGVEYIPVPFPAPDAKPSLEYLVNGFCVFDNGDAARAEASKKFIQFICDDSTEGPKNVVQTGAFPVRKSFGDLYSGNDEYTLLAQWTEMYAPYYNTMNGFPEMRANWFNMLQAVLAGSKTPEQAAKDYAAASNAAMQ